MPDYAVGQAAPQGDTGIRVPGLYAMLQRIIATANVSGPVETAFDPRFDDENEDPAVIEAAHEAARAQAYEAAKVLAQQRIAEGETITTLLRPGQPLCVAWLHYPTDRVIVPQHFEHDAKWDVSVEDSVRLNVAATQAYREARVDDEARRRAAIAAQAARNGQLVQNGQPTGDSDGPAPF